MLRELTQANVEAAQPCAHEYARVCRLLGTRPSRAFLANDAAWCRSDRCDSPHCQWLQQLYRTAPPLPATDPHDVAPVLARCGPVAASWLREHGFR